MRDPVVVRRCPVCKRTNADGWRICEQCDVKFECPECFARGAHIYATAFYRPNGHWSTTKTRQGHLTIIGPDSSRNRNAYWTVRCDCGAVLSVSRRALRRGVKKCRKCVRVAACQRHIYARYKTGAQKHRGLKWALTFEQFIALSEQDCTYCGLSPSTKAQSQAIHTHNQAVWLRNGIDRRDNYLGYTVDNSVPCCSVCNHAKCTMSEADFRAWIARAYTHQNQPRAAPPSSSLASPQDAQTTEENQPPTDDKPLTQPE